jgi:hypothetical protein
LGCLEADCCGVLPLRKSSTGANNGTGQTVGFTRSLPRRRGRDDVDCTPDESNGDVNYVPRVRRRWRRPLPMGRTPPVATLSRSVSASTPTALAVARIGAPAAFRLPLARSIATVLDKGVQARPVLIIGIPPTRWTAFAKRVVTLPSSASGPDNRPGQTGKAEFSLRRIGVPAATAFGGRFTPNDTAYLPGWHPGPQAPRQCVTAAGPLRKMRRPLRPDDGMR